MSKVMGTGNGSVYYEASRKKFKARIRDPFGKLLTKRCDTEKEANAWLKRVASQITLSEYVQEKDITVMEWIKTYLRTYKASVLRPKTLLRYVETAEHLKPIGDIQLQNLTSADVQELYNSLKDMSDSSKIKVHQLLNAAIKRADANGLLKRNPMLAVEPPRRKKKREIEVFTDEEIEKVKAVTLGTRYYPIILIALATGMRLGEILGLKAESLFPDHIVINNSLQQVRGRIIDMPPKTETSNRTIEIPHELYDILPKASYGYVFKGRRSEYINPSNLNHAWKKILADAGVPHKRFHSLRHTHATALLHAGVPIDKVSQRLGHANISITLNTYIHASKEYDHAIANKVTELFM